MAARRTGQTPLTRERITRAAMRIVDAEGLAALSMRRLGTELKVDPSSIYYHVPNKSALYELLVDAVMSEMDLSADNPEDPTAERLINGLLAFGDALLAHPRAIPLVASRPLMTPDSLRPGEHLLGVLHDGGVDYVSALMAINAIGYYVMGATLAYANRLLQTEYSADFDVSRIEALSDSEFPHLKATIAAAGPNIEFAEEFRAGAAALVAGILSTTHIR
jgi:TetR/AcrR family transcriptional regulator, tetracycline repressor protein